MSQPPTVFLTGTATAARMVDALEAALVEDGLGVISVNNLSDDRSEARLPLVELADAYVAVVLGDPAAIPQATLDMMALEAEATARRGGRLFLLADDIRATVPAVLREDWIFKVTSLDAVVDVAASITEVLSDRRTPVDLVLHPPATQPEPDDAGMVVSDTEVLLSWAERFVADEANADDVRDEVDARRRQLRDELRLIEQGRGRSAVLTGISGALLDLVRPEPAADGLGAALDEVADGLGALGRASSDDERVAAGEEVVAALDHVGEEVAELIEVNDLADLKVAAYRTAGAFLQEDLRPHTNAFLTALRERALPAGGGAAAGGAAIGLAGGPPWLAVTIVAAGLLRSLFPWIFPRRTPPEDPPPEG